MTSFLKTWLKTSDRSGKRGRQSCRRKPRVLQLESLDRRELLTGLVSISSPQITEGANPATANFVVTYQPGPFGPFSAILHCTTSDGTARAGRDYVPIDRTVTVSGGSQVTVPVSIVDDSYWEGDETFRLSAVSLNSESGSGIATIHDNDPKPTISILDPAVQVTEGNPPQPNATFRVQVTGNVDGDVTVGYATGGGTATGGSGGGSIGGPDLSDYIAVSGQLTWHAPQNGVIQTISVPIVDDSRAEPAETFNVALSNPTNAWIGAGSAIGTILDNDRPSVSISDMTLTEGDAGSTIATFSVSLTRGNSQPVTVTYTTADGSAKVSDGDYQFKSSTLQWAANDTSVKPIDIVI